MRSCSNTLYRTMNLQNERRSFLPLKSVKGSVKLGKPISSNTNEAQKVKLRKATEGFEAIFIRLLLKTMRSTIPDGGMFGKGAVGEIYGDMMDNTLAEVMSRRSILGLADTLYRQLVREIEPEETKL